jgi:hypothetical protein
LINDNKMKQLKTTVKQRLVSRYTAALASVLSALALTVPADRALAQAAGSYGTNNAPPGAMSLNPGVDYTVGNYAYSPPLRKFVDQLPGLLSSSSNSLGQYIPVAVPNTPYGSPYANCQYYEIGLVEYFEQMHQDLPVGGTKLRGYVQIVPSTYAGAVPLDTAHGLSMNVTNTAGQLLYGADKPHYMGPMIVAFKNIPVRVKFTNLLPTGPAGRIFLPSDSTILGAGDGPHQTGVDVNGAPVYEQYTQNRANIHLHGGFPPWISDGTPHQWITPAGESTSYHKGPDALNVPDMPDPGDGSMTYYWPNLQSGRLLWYHDHTYGSTGPDVYAGEAAPYLIVDQQEETLLAAAGVPGVMAAGPAATNDLAHMITLVIQDKTFVPDPTTMTNLDPLWLTDVVDGMTGVAPVMGSLWMPHVYVPNQWPNNPDGSGANGIGRWDYGPWFWPPWIVGTPYPPRVSHCPESFQDTPVVNGQPYPYLNVDPAKYRIKFLDAADDRYWNLQLYVASSIISNILVTAGGSGYSATMPPNVNITGGGGIGALATAIVDPVTTAVTGINIVVTGSGFTNAPTVTIDPPTAVGGVQATAEAQIYTGNTEVGLVQASTTAGIPFPTTWRVQTVGYTPDILDNRPGGVPDPTKRGPAMVKIANEGGILPNPVVISNTPVGFEQSKKAVTVLNVKQHGLWLAPAERADVVVDFTHFAGKTIILYNDSPAALPAADARNDLYTEDGDQTGGGGPGNTNPGMGPNTRTVMQFRVAAASAATPNANSTAPVDDYDKTMVAALTNSVSGMPFIFGATQPVPVVPEAAYNSVGYTGGSQLNTYATIQATNLTFIPYGQTTPVTILFKAKCIQELFDENGRLNALLGVELPFQNQTIQTTVPLNYVDPITELFNDGETQIWKITHNGVDSHCVHFHLVNVQIVNRVAWDGTIKPPDADEVGWKETVRMHPLQDIIVATRAVSVPSPFGVSNSWRYLAPSEPPNSPLGFSNWDPTTGATLAVPTLNTRVNFNWAYIWHCHLLGHEENDMMRPISLTVKSYVPKAPVLTGSASLPAPGTAQVNLSWTDGTPYNYTTGLPTATVGNPTNEIGFRIERADATTRVATYAVVTNVPANTTNFVDVTVRYPSTNLYRVVAYNTAGDATSASLNVKVVPLAPPPAPGGLKVLVSSLNPVAVTLTWTNPVSVTTAVPDSFEVQRSTAGGAYVSIANVAGATLKTYTDTTAVLGTAYSYQVRAVNLAGNSAFCAPVSVLWPPTAPSNLTAIADSSSTLVNLAWTAGARQTGYRIEWAIGTNAFATLANVNSNSVAYADTTVVATTTYSYRVFGTNSGGSSLPSNTATVTTPSAPQPPAAPSGLTAKLTGMNPATVALNWINTATNASAFNIWRATGTNAFASLTTVSGANVTNYNDTTVAAGNTYTYQVRATNAGGFSSFAVSAPVTVAIRYVQAAASPAVASASTITTPALSTNQTAGNLNIVVVSWTGVATNVSSVVDNGGKTYTLAGTVTSAAGNLRQSVYYTAAAAGAGRTVTVTFTGAAISPGVRVLEYSGVTTLDRSGTASGTTSPATVTAGGLITTAANELVFAAAATTSTVTAAGSGYTSRISSANTIAEDKIATAILTSLFSTGMTATATVTTPASWVIQTYTFK